MPKLPPSTRAHQNEINSEAWESKRIFENRATQGDIDAGLEQVALFTARYPQFVGSVFENRQALMEWLKQNNRTVKFANLVAAFEALVLEGRVIVSPAAIGAGTEQQVSGFALRKHPNLHLLLKPGPTEKEREQREIGKLSADDYKKQLKNSNTSNPWRSREIEQVGATFQSFHPEWIPSDDNKTKLLEWIDKGKTGFSIQALEAAYKDLRSRGELELSDAVEVGQITLMANYGAPSRGVPPEPEKYSFKKLVRNMSASELAQRCSDDPAFRASLNALE